MTIIIKLKRTRAPHKFKAILPGKVIKFGAAGYSDYTIHKNKERKRLYLNRHRNEDWNNFGTAGFWARWILWSKPTIRESIKHLESKFKSIKISWIK